MESKSMVLLFQIEPTKARQIQQLCTDLQIKCKTVAPHDYEQSLGYLADISGFKKGKVLPFGNPFPSEMLVFSGIPQPLFDQFLEKYKQSLIAPTPLKAILTIHNISWTPRQLFTELQKEHAKFHP